MAVPSSKLGGKISGSIASMMADSSLEARTAVHAALADSHRLAIVDELSLSDRSPSELRRQLGIESNLLAHHLAVLERAGLVERVTSAGDRRRRYVRLVSDALASVWTPPTRLAADGVLFICTGNSARSQLAAALWNAARGDIAASSAGTQPAQHVHPGALAAGARAGLDLRHAGPRSLDAVHDVPELVITVCDRAREELIHRPLTSVILHWSIPDPAEDGRPAAFDAAIRRLSVRVGALAPLVGRPERRRPIRGGRVRGRNRSPAR
jgi:protein-tyrosine-phosphatase/DNA-binding HxlR family transcriptional regulator